VIDRVEELRRKSSDRFFSARLENAAEGGAEVEERRGLLAAYSEALPNWPSRGIANSSLPRRFTPGGGRRGVPVPTTKLSML